MSDLVRQELLRTAVSLLCAAIADAELRTRHHGGEGVVLRLYGEGSGYLEIEGRREGDPGVFLFYSIDELVAWIKATPDERAALETAERTARAEREGREFATLDLLVAAAGGVQ